MQTWLDIEALPVYLEGEVGRHYEEEQVGPWIWRVLWKELNRMA